MPQELEMMGRLVLAAVLGGVIGLERESLSRPAGFRTHILVSIGSSLLAMVSFHVTAVHQGVAAADPGRIAAQVVSGIGFLGAGTILRAGVTVRGLTTAASLWTVAGVGLAVGVGLYLPAVVTTVIVLGALLWLNRIDFMLQRRQQEVVRVYIDDTPGRVGEMGTLFGRYGLNISRIEISTEGQDGVAELTFFLRCGPDVPWNTLFAEMTQVVGVRSAHKL